MLCWRLAKFNNVDVKEYCEHKDTLQTNTLNGHKYTIFIRYNTALTHFWPMFPFYNSSKHQKKKKGFQVFSGSIKLEHWPEMNYILFSTKYLDYCFPKTIFKLK